MRFNYHITGWQFAGKALSIFSLATWLKHFQSKRKIFHSSRTKSDNNKCNRTMVLLLLIADIAFCLDWSQWQNHVFKRQKHQHNGILFGRGVKKNSFKQRHPVASVLLRYFYSVKDTFAHFFIVKKKVWTWTLQHDQGVAVQCLAHFTRDGCGSFYSYNGIHGSTRE